MGKHSSVCYDYTCAYCGKEFVSHRKNKMYCSWKCRDISYRIQNGIKCNTNLVPFRRVCPECGKEFETFREAAVTCSHECARKRHNRRQGRSKPKTIKQCCICGKTFETFHDSQVTCGTDACKKAQRKIQQKQLVEKKKIEQRFYRATHMIERECKICGSLFYCLDTQSNQTCSHDCSVEYTKIRRREYHDHRLNKTNIIDFDITLEKLFLRDNGKCHICGGFCDWSDFAMRDGIKICGKSYPSKDHVIPLAKGGLHSWENVRLAHLGCNVEKSDTTPTYTKEMSREHARKLAVERCDNRKRTAQYTLDGELLKIWDSTAQIKRELGLNDKHIQSVCRKYKSNTGNAYGFHWEYIVEHEDVKLKEVQRAEV